MTALRNFNNNVCLDHLKSIPWYEVFLMKSIDDTVSFSNDYIIMIFDIYPPLVTCKFSQPLTPWITDNVKLLMSLRDKALYKYKNLVFDWNYDKSLRNHTIQLQLRVKRKIILNLEWNVSIK